MQPQGSTRSTSSPERHDTIVIGGGQAGLAAGYCLSQGQRDFIIVDENPQTGTSWRKRWDSLRLFTPTQLSGLPGLPFPKPNNYFPTKNEMAAYLQEYAERFALPVRNGIKVDRLVHSNGSYEIGVGDSTFSATNVIVATGPYRLPKVPAFASQLNASMTQLHSSAYCNPAQIAGQRVLVVGAGNSGAEIALELSAAGKQVWLSGRDVGNLPIASRIGRAFGGRLAWWIMSHVLTVDTPMGRRARSKFIHHGHPLGRARRPELMKAGVKLARRVSGVEAGNPELEDGQLLPVECIVWATGYRPDYGWIDLPIFGPDGYPNHRRGVIERAQGLYFVGLPYQTAFSSSLLGGVGRDAAYIARQVAQR